MKVLKSPCPEARDRSERCEFDPAVLSEDLAKRGLWYRPEVLADLAVAARPPALVLLAGAPGTGKSELARCLAEHLTRAHGDEGSVRVTVRPEWHSARQLLGEYDRASGRFHATPLLSLWLRALRHKAKTYVAVLEGLDRSPGGACLAEVLSVRMAGETLLLHEDHLRCRPRAGLADDLVNFFVCHQDCSACFFVRPGYPKGVTDAVRDFVPARIAYPENLLLVGVLDGPPGSLDRRLQDAAALVEIPTPGLEELLVPLGLEALTERRSEASGYQGALAEVGIDLSPRTWREVEALVREGVELPAALRVRAGPRISGLAPEDRRRLEAGGLIRAAYPDSTQK